MAIKAHSVLVALIIDTLITRATQLLVHVQGRHRFACILVKGHHLMLLDNDPPRISMWVHVGVVLGATSSRAPVQCVGIFVGVRFSSLRAEVILLALILAPPRLKLCISCAKQLFNIDDSALPFNVSLAYVVGIS